MAGAFRTTWDPVFGAVEMAVAWGRQHQDLTGITAIGLDELQWRRGHQCLTLVYQLDPGAKRLLWLGELRVSAHRERSDRSIVNTEIGPS